MSPTYRSFAKINLHLQVIGRRADGYHELRTVFQTVDLSDLVRIELTGRDDGVVLELRQGEVPGGRQNLAVRAAEAFLTRWRPDLGVEITLHKRIPVGGGLGGGSSNAATVLHGLQEQLGRPAGPGELWRLARELGADVPYFLLGGTALGVGRGDEVIPLNDLAESELWLVTPPVAVSTREVFSRLEHLTARPLTSSIMALVQGCGPDRIEAIQGTNDLQDLVFRDHPLVQQVYTLLIDTGARPVGLSGSGATLFACSGDRDIAARVARDLPTGSTVFRVRSLSRGSVEKNRVVH